MIQPNPIDRPDAIEAEVVPLSGCALAVLGILSLGIVPLVMRSSERAWPRWLDADGFTTRANRRYRWSEIRRLRQVVTFVNQVRTERWDLETDRGAVASIVEHRLRNGPQVLAFARRQIARASHGGETGHAH